MDSLITSTLERAAEEVEVPVLDELALSGRVRRLRRRRRTGLAVAGVAAASVAALLATTLPAVLDADRGGSDDVAGLPRGAAGPVPFALGGVLQVQEAYDTRSTGVRVEEVVAVREDGVLVVDDDSHALLVPLDGSAPTRPTGEAAVQRVLAAPDGTIAWVDLTDRLWLRWPDGTTRRGTGVDAPDQRVYDVDAGRWLQGEGAWIALTDGHEGVRIETGGPIASGEVAGGTVAATSDDGTTFLDAATGAPRTGPVARTGPVGGRTGALSPDGRWWVANPNPEETASGLVPGLLVWDTGTGASREFVGFDDTGAVIDVAWQGDRALAVVETHAAGAVLRTLYSCSVEELACEYLYEDESGTLTLPTS